MELVEQCNEERIRFVTATYDYWVESNNQKYLDLMCGHGAYIWGYSNQILIKALNKQINEVQFVRGKSSEQNYLLNEVTDKLLQMSGMSGVLYAISGSDGVEAGLEISDQYWKNLKQNKNKIISFTPGYHGATYLARQLRGEKKSDRNIVLPAPSDDQQQDEKETLKLIKKILDLDKYVGTIIIESIPWINGIRPWSEFWWTEIRRLCTEYRILLVIDDVWGGFGKVGPAFSYQKYNIIPDISIMGKSITGGYVPLSCALVSSKVLDVVKQTVHYGHTWQPQMLGIALTNQILQMFDSNLVENINLKHIILFDKLKLYGVKDYRGFGLAKELLLDRPVSKLGFERAGLCTSHYMKNSIFLITPMIADDLYWDELEKRLITLLKKTK